MVKNIALFIDGTGNDRKKNGETNVHKLFERALACQEPPILKNGVPIAAPGATQIVHYLRGVGTGWNPDPVVRAATGLGTAKRIKHAYGFIAKNYQPNDRVYLFGFSRGAFAARALAGFLGVVGVLLAKHASWDSVAYAYRLYEQDKRGEDSYLPELFRRLTEAGVPPGHLAENNPPRPIPIYFIGVWDAVKALGAEGVSAKDWANWSSHPNKPALPRHITHARHALALHELRPAFEPTLWEDWDETLLPPQSLMQVWFPGAHSDVGGSYEKTGISDVSLAWMAGESRKFDLKLHPSTAPTTSTWPSSDTVHLQKMGRELATREILSDWRAMPRRRVVESFFMHELTGKQLTSLVPGTHRMPIQQPKTKLPARLHWRPLSGKPLDEYRAKLQEVDELTLVLYLAICLKYQRKAVTNEPS